MRFHTYSKYSPEMADAVDLQSLLDKLADFLLQSGFAGQQGSSYYGMGRYKEAAAALQKVINDYPQADHEYWGTRNLVVRLDEAGTGVTLTEQPLPQMPDELKTYFEE